MGLFIGMRFELCCRPFFFGEVVRSSSSEEPRKKIGEALSKNASTVQWRSLYSAGRVLPAARYSENRLPHTRYGIDQCGSTGCRYIADILGYRVHTGTIEPR